MAGELGPNRELTDWSESTISHTCLIAGSFTGAGVGVVELEVVVVLLELVVVLELLVLLELGLPELELLALEDA